MWLSSPAQANSRISARTEVEAELRVVAVVRVRHAEVVAELVDRGRREAESKLAILRRVEHEDVRLGAVDPVVVGESKQAKLRTERRGGRVVSEDFADVIARTIVGDIAGQVRVEVAEQLREGVAEQRSSNRPPARFSVKMSSARLAPASMGLVSVNPTFHE